MRWSDAAMNNFNECLARHRAESVINEAKSGKEDDFDLVAAKLMSYAEMIDSIRLKLLCANPHEDEGEYALAGIVEDLSHILGDYCVAPCELQLCERCDKEQDMPLCVSCEIAIENGEDRWLNGGYRIDTGAPQAPGAPI